MHTRLHRGLFVGLSMLASYALCLWLYAPYYYNPDEIAHLHIASGKTLLDVWKYSLYETHPPLGHFLRHYWMMLGDNVWLQRHLTILFGLALFPVMYLLGKEVGGRRTGLIAVAILAFAHYQIQSMGSIRHYAFGNLFLMTSLLFLFRFLRHQRPWELGLYSLLALLAVFSAYLNLIVLFCITAVICLRQASQRKWRIALLIAAASGLPALAGFCHYAYQRSFFSHYIEFSQISSREYYPDSTDLLLTNLHLALKIIPGVLFEMSWYYLRDGVGITLILLFIGALIFLFRVFLVDLLEKDAWRSFRESQKVIILAALLSVPVLFLMGHFFGYTLLFLYRRLVMVSLLILLAFSIGFARLRTVSCVTGILFCVLLSLPLNSYRGELTTHFTTWEKVQNLSIYQSLGSKHYLLFASTFVTGYFLEAKAGGIYRYVTQNREKHQILLPDRGIAHHNALTIWENIFADKRLYRLLKRYRSKRPYMVFVVQLWETEGPYAREVFRCLPHLPGAKVLLAPPEGTPEYDTEMFIVAAPYDEMQRYIESDGATCRNLPPSQDLPQS